MKWPFATHVFSSLDGWTIEQHGDRVYLYLDGPDGDCLCLPFELRQQTCLKLLAFGIQQHRFVSAAVGQ